MARKIGAGVLEISFYPSGHFANDQAPTSTELNDAAEVDLTGFLTDGGLATPFDGSVVDNADMSSKFNKTASGTFGGNPLTAEFFRDFPLSADTAWSTLARGTAGYFAIARGGKATPGTWAIGDELDLWAIEVVTRNPVDVARNEMQRFTAECAVPAVPLEDFAVVA